MRQYILKRILAFVPTLVIVVAILFIIKSALPGDPIVDYLTTFSQNDESAPSYLSDYHNLATKMGLNIAPFYFSIQPKSIPKDIYQIIPLEKRNQRKQEILDAGFSWPTFRWYGSKNQFHFWITNMIKGDMGASMVDGRNVSKKVGAAMKWTFLLMLLSLIFSVGLSIPIGIWLARKKNRVLKKVFQNVSFFIYTVPLFWLCLLALIFLTSDYYGLKLFASASIDPTISRLGFWQGVGQNITKLILPALCWIIHSLAYSTLQMKTSLNQEFSKDYIVTAYAKGLSEKDTSIKHALKNALIPMITLFMSSIPSALAGSVVIESIFNIPGIGRLLINSIYSVDWNVVIAIVLIIALVTMMSYLIADLLYAWVNPKIKYGKGE